MYNVSTMKPKALAAKIKDGHQDHGCGGSCYWHHTDEQPSVRDVEIGDVLAYAIGKTGIEDIPPSKLTSVLEWSHIVKALRLHGLAIRPLKSRKLGNRE